MGLCLPHFRKVLALITQPPLLRILVQAQQAKLKTTLADLSEVIRKYDYRNTTEAALAMERGEVDGGLSSWNTLKRTRPGWIEKEDLNLLVQYATERHPDLGNVPTALEVAQSSEGRRALAFYVSGAELGRSLVMPPGVPAWTATDLVPDEGMQAWDAADGTRPPVAQLPGRVELRVMERNGAWARVAAANGWSGWVDGRLLRPLGG